MAKMPVQAIGRLLNAVRGLESVVATVAPNHPSMKAIDRELSEATRILTEWTTYPISSE